jgi:PKD repeat protein
MADPFFSNVVLLVANDNKGNGTTSFADQSNAARAMTANGNAQYSTARAPTGMTSSYLGDGTGDFLSALDSTDFALGTGDFTLEAYVYWNTAVSFRTIFSKRVNSAPSQWIFFGSNGTGVQWYASSGGGAWDIASAQTVGTIAAGQWYHVALTRSGNNFTPWLNGVAGSGTVTSAASIGIDTNALRIGADSNGLSLDGNIACVRITKGVARYTANFTPPALPLPLGATAPVADFSGTPLSGTAPLSVAFTDASTNTPTSWAWTFGDGGTSTAQNPSHVYASAGTYNVGLTATNSGGSNLATKNAYITVNDVVVATTAPSGGIVDLGRNRRKKTKEELAAEREKFGIPDEARIAIEEAARRQALAQEQSAQDEQKNFEELSRELTLRGIEWDVRYLEAMNTLREKLIEQQREEVMKAKRDEEDVMYLLQVVAEVA